MRTPVLGMSGPADQPGTVQGVVCGNVGVGVGLAVAVGVGEAVGVGVGPCRYLIVR